MRTPCLQHLQLKGAVADLEGWEGVARCIGRTVPPNPKPDALQIQFDSA